MQRLVQLVLFLLLLTCPLWSAQSLIQSVTNTACASSTTCATTVASTGTGHLLVAVANAGSFSATISSVSGGCSVSWVAAGLHNNRSDAAYCLSSSSGATSITITWSVANAADSVFIAEYSTSSGPFLFDTSGITAGTLCSPCTGQALTLSGANDVIIQWVSNHNSASFSAISGAYTSPAIFLGTSLDAYAGAINTNIGTAPSWTISTPSTTAVSAFAFKDTIGTSHPISSVVY
jgi:hypothetical protein